MNIDDLLNRYFEGETSSEEERQIRAFFASDSVPEHLLVYKPLFAYFGEEIKKETGHRERKLFTPRSALFLLSGVAAILFLLLGISGLLRPADPCFCSGNYVVINGRCYTDIHKVRLFAVEALQEVATPANEYFPEAKEDAEGRDILENQLKELGSLFSDEE